MADRRPPRSARSTASATSNNTTRQTSLAKRLLLPSLPPGAPLPPLFASPACPPELHEEVYDFIALALRAYVNTWWSKITRYDKEFLPQLTHILTHVIRTLEQRLLAADLSVFALCDIPALVTEHYIDYRHAATKVSTSYATGGAHTLPHLFHQLQPHLAVSAEGKLDEEYFRHALDLALKICLPPEDYAPGAERYIVRELFLKLIVRDVIPRITQPWFIQRSVLDLIGPPPDRTSSKPPGASSPNQHAPHFSNWIVLFLSAIQSLSGACLALIHAYKQAISTIRLVNKSSTKRSTSVIAIPPPLRPDSPSGIHKCSRSVSRESSYSFAGSPSPSIGTPQHLPPPEGPVDNDFVRGPLMLLCEVFELQWRSSSAIAFNLLYMVCCFFRTFINNFLCYMLYNQVLSTASVLSIVRLSKGTLFPNGYPGPSPVDPTPEEQDRIRGQLIRRVTEMIPGPVSAILLGPSPVASLETAIDPLSDGACNAHLAVLLFDAILLTVFPELGIREDD
ncbi:PXA domain-containing protein [Scleroderma yunnanense]